MRERDSNRTFGLAAAVERLRALVPRRRDFRWPRASALLFVSIPAFLAGYHLAALLLFLNPDLPYDGGALARGAGGLGLLLVPLSTAAHWVATRWRNVRLARLLPWSLTAVLATAALQNWVHVSIFSFYLLPAFGAGLIKAALWLSLGAVLGFYTALLHTASHRRYGARSVALLAFVTLASLYVAFDRRRSVREPAAPPALGAVSESRGAPRMLVVEVDGATLDVFLPLARQSRLPFFSSLLEQGVNARLATVPPLRPPAARASLATGKLPYRHRIAAETIQRFPWFSSRELRLLPIGFDALGLNRILASSRAVVAGDRRALTVPEIAAALGLRTAVIGAPRELLSRIALAAQASDDRFVLPDGGTAATPAPFDAQIQLLRDAGAFADPPALERFDGDLRETLRQALQEDRWRAASAATLLGESGGVDALFLRLPGFFPVARESRGAFELAELEGKRGADERRAAEALTVYCAALDSALADLWERLRPPRVLVVVSAFGVDPPRGLRRIAGEIGRVGRLGGTLSSEPDGALWMRGEEIIRAAASLPPARTVDVAPTLLYLAGLPIARDLDGRVLTEAIEPVLLKRRPLSFLPSYEPLAPRR